jgi:hypothetical protein
MKPYYNRAPVELTVRAILAEADKHIDAIRRNTNEIRIKAVLFSKIIKSISGKKIDKIF